MGKTLPSFDSSTTSLYVTRFIFNSLRDVQFRLLDCLPTCFSITRSQGIAWGHRHIEAEVIMGTDEQVSYIMLFCALMLVKNSKATMEQSLSIVPLAGKAKSLTGKLFSKDSRGS